MKRFRHKSYILSIMRFNRILITLLYSNFLSYGQFNFEYNSSIEVKKDGSTLIDAWAGGLDYAQFSTFDFDYDGDLDLFVFDRSSDNIRVFVQETEAGQQVWKSIYNASQFFPTDLMYRATMIDFDSDGKSDIFTYSIGGLKVYRNIGNSTDGLQWELFQNIVYSDYNGFKTNLYVASSDIPAIVDVDFDGDIDILTFHQGGQHLEYHKNMSMENYGIPDSLEFVLANECWGKFSENATNNSVILNDINFPCQNGVLPNPEIPPIDKPNFTNANTEFLRHAGSTVLALDYDNSGVMDLILGDVAFENLVLLINGGTAPNTNSPMISADVNFPSNTLPATMYLFPAPFYLDVDFDGVKDLLVGANAKNVSQNETSILYYKNIGTNNNPTFVYQRNNFLQNQMIEHGKGSIPILYDVDNDGLKDLLVSNLYRFKNSSEKESTIAWYKNTGTASNPVFTFIDFNWLNLNQQNYGLRLAPTFGDINNDGRDELILGRENGTLVLFQNNGTTFVNPSVNLKDNNNTTIQVGGFSFPQLFDLNKDGLLDLIIGNRTGKLIYYQNIGTASTPSFQLTNNNLGNISINDPNNPDGYTAPHFFRIDDTTHLFLGAVDGKLHYYNGIDGNLSSGQSFNLVSSEYLDINVNAYSSFWINDIDNDNLLNLFIGQDLGGLYHFEVDTNSTISVENITKPLSVKLFPNPTTGKITIETNTHELVQLSIYSINGQLLRKEYITGVAIIDLQSFEKGIYLIELLDNKESKSIHRVSKQ
jgi:hypothetical protein